MPEVSPLNIQIDYKPSKLGDFAIGALAYLCAAVSFVSLRAAFWLSDAGANLIVKRGLKIKVL